MEAKTLYTISKILEKLENKPLFQYFNSDPKFSSSNQDGSFFTLLKEDVLLNRINSPKDEVHQRLTRFLNSCIATEGITQIEVVSIKYLQTFINEKFSSLTTYELNDWKTKWCDLYQELVLHLKTMKSEAPLKEMRLNNDSLPIPEEELLKLSEKIKSLSNDHAHEKELLILLISTLENGTANLNDECQFDLHDLKDETLFAIKTFLSKIEDNSEEAKFLKK